MSSASEVGAGVVDAFTRSSSLLDNFFAFSLTKVDFGLSFRDVALSLLLSVA